MRLTRFYISISLTGDPKGLYCVDGFWIDMAETGIDAMMKDKSWVLKAVTEQDATRKLDYVNGAYEIVFDCKGGRVTAIEVSYMIRDA